MSLSYQKLTPVKVIDPITDVAKPLDYAVLEGGSKISFKAYTSTSIASSSIQFSCPPPSSNIIVDRAQKVTLPIRLTIVGNISSNTGSYAPTCTLLNEGKDAPRAFPISSMLETLQVSLNNDSVSINMADVIHPLSRYNVCTDVLTKEFSMAPVYPDQSSNYSDLDGCNRNPLGNYADGYAMDIIPRGGFPFTIVQNPSQTGSVAGNSVTAIVDMLVTEDLKLSPFYFGSDRGNNRGFFNLTSMDFNLNFLNSGMRAWSHSDAPVATSGSAEAHANITSISAQFNGFSPAFSYATAQPQMLFKYYTPNLLMPLSPSMPYSYPFCEVIRYPSDIGTLAYADGLTYFNSNSIQLNQIPRRVYIFARPSNSELQADCTLTDTYLAINNVSVQFANNATVLSTATPQQLFAMNVKNHGSQSWSEWSGLGVYNSGFPGTSGYAQFCGGCGPLCLEFGTDIQLESKLYCSQQEALKACNFLVSCC